MSDQPADNGTEGFTIVKPPETGAADAPRRKGGRPKDPNKLLFDTVGLRQGDWEYLKLWGPGETTNDAPDNPTVQLGALIEYTRTMAKLGPGKFGHEIDPEKRKAEKTTPAIKKYADAHGLTKAQATNMAWRAFVEAERAKDEQNPR